MSEREGEPRGAHFERQNHRVNQLCNYELPITNYELVEETETRTRGTID